MSVVPASTWRSQPAEQWCSRSSAAPYRAALSFGVCAVVWDVLTWVKCRGDFAKTSAPQDVAPVERCHLTLAVAGFICLLPLVL